MNQYPPELYSQAMVKAQEIEAELKRINRWCSEPLSDEKFENMGAFGSNTMAFEQWLQFVLIPRILSIVEERSEFPDSSSIAPYAIRYFDGDGESDQLHEILYGLDELINGINRKAWQPSDFTPQSPGVTYESLTLGEETIPSVVYTLAGLLRQFEGDALESQLQTFDTFLAVLSPKVRPTISKLLYEAAQSCSSPGKQRIEKAAESVGRGDRAAEPYDHEKAMKKYMEEHRKSYEK